MKRFDFLKTLAVPFVIPFFKKEKEPKFLPGDLAYFNGDTFSKINPYSYSNKLVLDTDNVHPNDPIESLSK